MLGSFAVRELSLAALLASLLIWDPASAQSVLVPDDVTCAECTFLIDQGPRIGSANGPGFLPRAPMAVKVDSLGRIWMSFQNGLPLVFDADGSFITVLGGKGEGPEEFLAPSRFLPIPGDSVVVFDSSQRRASVVGPDLRVGRTLRMPGGASRGEVVRWPDTVFMAGMVNTPAAVGWPMHLVDFSGQGMSLSRSFGSKDGDVRALSQSLLLRELSAPRDGALWVIDVVRYRMTRWSTGGDLLAEVERRPEWFSGPSSWSSGNPDTPPPPFIQGIEEDASGLLWVYVRVQAPDWQDAWPEIPSGVMEIFEGEGASAYELYRSVVEVIDPVAGRVIARSSLPGLVCAALPGHRVAIYEEDEIGVPYVRILSLGIELRKPPTATGRF